MAYGKSVRARLRLTAAEVRLLNPGLRRIVVGLADIERRRTSINAQIDAVFGPPRSKSGSASLAQVNRLRIIWSRLYPIFQQAQPPVHCIRLSADCFDLAACALSARLSLRMSSDEVCSAQLKSLQQKLEMYRKRGVRAYRRVHGRCAYATAAAEWRAFVRWIRFHILRRPRFAPARPINPRKRPLNSSRAMVKAGMEAAAREIESREQSVPPQSELRHYVRLAIRHVRRGRVGLSVRALLTTETGAFFLATWVLRRVEKRRNQPPIASCKQTKHSLVLARSTTALV
ncbi:MAG: hypothetical protein ACRD3Q_05155 [Terriglobales bacterium]